MSALEIRTFGQGPAVVCLHGAPTAPSHFDVLAAALAPRHRVHVVSLPGYGGSARVAPYAHETVHAILERAFADAGDLAVVGFSSGAYHALALAVRRTLPIRAVVSLGGFACMRDPDRALMRQFAEMLRGGIDAGDILPARMLSESWRAEHPETVEDVRGWSRATKPEILADELDAFADAADLLPAIGELAIPVLARVGALDVAAPPVRSEEIAQAAGRGTLEIVEGVGHALLHEDQLATIASVARALG